MFEKKMALPSTAVLFQKCEVIMYETFKLVTIEVFLIFTKARARIVELTERQTGVANT